MLNLIRRCRDANAQTKFFALNWIVYGIALLITTLYCYGRLDFVRSYRTGPVSKQILSPAKIEDIP